MADANAKPIVLDVNALTVNYGVITALHGISMQIRQGDIVTLIGANGAGKTTTLKLLMRLIFPTSGSARILDRDIEDVRMHERIGYLPENPYF